MSAWRMLLVDDNPMNLRIMAESLAENGQYELAMATDGAMAWEMLTRPESAFHLVILDRMMPGMDGLELLQRMKAEPRFQRTPVIMQTALSQPEHVAEGIAAGAYYYLGKPYQPEALATIVRSVVSDLESYAIASAHIADKDNALKFVTRAEFRLTTLEQARALAGLLATMCYNPGLAALGFSEFLINAVEHGNLGIDYATTAHFKRINGLEQEILRRYALPEYCDRFATVTIERRASDAGDELCISIRDQGEGFDWTPYLQLDPNRAFDPNGRGIAMAHVAFSDIEYRGCGNEVVITVLAYPVEICNTV